MYLYRITVVVMAKMGVCSPPQQVHVSPMLTGGLFCPLSRSQVVGSPAGIDY